MRALFDKLGKTGTAIATILAIVTGIITCWQFVLSSEKYNLSGAWKLEFKVKSSSYKPYIGETHTQKVFFTQSETEIEGHGEKWEYNGELLPFNAHRKLEYKGTINDNELKATYVLHGLKRVSEGIIHVMISDDGEHLEGKFSGTAGESSGTVTGEKINL